MKVQVKQEYLSKAVALVSRVASVRATLPVLANILLRTENGRLRLTATDLEVGLTTWIRAKIDVEGSFTVPARLLVDFVSNNTDENLTLEQVKETLKIVSEHHSVTMNGIPDTEFPLIPTLTGATEFTLPAATVKDVIGQTLFAASIDDTRPVLAGVLFTANEHILTIAATDSYRLAERRVTLKDSVLQLRRIVPHRALAELSRMLPADGEVKFSFMENQVQVQVDDRELVSRLIDGNYPDYQAIIPKAPIASAIVNRKELVDSVRLSSFFARDSSNHVKIHVKETSIEIEAVSAQLGESRSTLKVETTGESLSVAFNAKFLLDVLNVMEGETVSFEFSGPVQAALLTDAALPDALFIVMPLRTEK